jgi:hypothetical protein
MPAALAGSAATCNDRPVAQLLPRFLEDERERREHAKVLEQIARETGGDVAQERKRHQVDPADSRTLRGLPAIGRSVQGCIRYTQPEQALIAKQPR